MHIVPAIIRTKEQGTTVHRVEWMDINKLVVHAPIPASFPEASAEVPPPPVTPVGSKPPAARRLPVLQALLYLICFQLVLSIIVCAQQYPTAFATTVLLALLWEAGPDKHAALAAASQQVAAQACRLALQTWHVLARRWSFWWSVAAKLGAAMRGLVAGAYSRLHSLLRTTSAVASASYNTAYLFGCQSASAIVSTSSAVSYKARETWLRTTAATTAFALVWGSRSRSNLQSLGVATLAGCSGCAPFLATSSVTIITTVSSTAQLSTAALSPAGRLVAALTYAILVRLYSVTAARASRFCRHSLPHLLGKTFSTALVAFEWFLMGLCEVCTCCFWPIAMICHVRMT